MTALRIAWKDLLITFRDRNALLFMLVAPILLTLGMALVSGQLFGSSGTTIENIPVAVVNLDGGEVSSALVAAFESPDLAGLLDVQIAADEAAARALVQDNAVSAAVIIPAGFSDTINGTRSAADADRIEIVANPEREVSAGVVTAVVESFLQRVELGRVSGQLAVERLLEAGLIAPAEASAVGQRIGERAAGEGDSGASLALGSSTIGADTSNEMNPMTYFAPAMAILFLMYTVSLGGRSLLAEKESGTLSRLAGAPIQSASILGGKLLGIFLTALAQMTILMAANTLLFQVNFGEPVALAALIVALAAAASGWGVLLSALARTPGQVSTFGTALMLTFGVLGGTFVPVGQMPEWFRLLAKITPNAWGLDGFIALGYGDGLAQIAGILAALAAMSVVLFAVSVGLLNRRRILQG